MAAKIRLFGYKATKQLAQGVPKHFNSDSVFVRQEPYLWSQVIELNESATPKMSAVQPDDEAAILVIEVPDSVEIRYEICPNGPGTNTARDAGDGSPRLAGVDAFEWFKGATVSVVNLSYYP